MTVGLWVQIQNELFCWATDCLPGNISASYQMHYLQMDGKTAASLWCSTFYGTLVYLNNVLRNRLHDHFIYSANSDKVVAFTAITSSAKQTSNSTWQQHINTSTYGDMWHFSALQDKIYSGLNILMPITSYTHTHNIDKWNKLYI